MPRLALRGGKPIRTGRDWPAWPQLDGTTEATLLRALRSLRWTVSCPSRGEQAVERDFAERFAAYNEIPYCVSVDHGSSALVVALEALDVGPGDEVIVPVQTWVATASSVLRVGALPVLADVDPETGCLTAANIRSALSSRTRAVIAVHLACTVADLDALTAAAEEAGVPLVEDCAQAHGARWRGRPVGTWGAVGAFSFQGGKVLASGEGGAVTTADPGLYRRLQQLRADSRGYAPAGTAVGEMELVEEGEVMGANYCMSELHAAILTAQLAQLDAQHQRRERMAAVLEKHLAALGDFCPVPVPAQADRRSIYEYAIQYQPGTFGEVPARLVAEAVSAELGMAVYPADDPLHRNVLFRPHTKRRFSAIWTPEGRTRAAGRSYPGAEHYARATLLFHHPALLGEPDDMLDIAEALAKVRDAHAEL